MNERTYSLRYRRRASMLAMLRELKKESKSLPFLFDPDWQHLSQKANLLVEHVHHGASFVSHVFWTNAGGPRALQGNLL